MCNNIESTSYEFCDFIKMKWLIFFFSEIEQADGQISRVICLVSNIAEVSLTNTRKFVKLLYYTYVGAKTSKM